MVLIGSSTATAAKFAVADLPVALLPIVRFGGAGLALLPLVWGRGALRRLVREDAPALLAAALLCVPINQAFFLNGTRLAPTTHVGLIYATCPLIVLALAVLAGQERLASSRLAGIALSVAGALVIALGAFAQPSGARGGASVLAGDLLLVGAVASWGAYLTINKRLVRRHAAVPVLVATFLLGALLSVPLAGLSLHEWPARLATARPAAWWGLGYLTLIVSVLGLACQNVALRRLDASHVATVGNLAPALTVLWGVWLLGEGVSPSLIAGGALTLAGVAWVSRAGAPGGARPVPARCPAPQRAA
jgi:drug/metabolite transporter (DMT)-like permease